MKDAFGNVLSKEDWVDCRLEDAHIIGQIIEIKEGGVALGVKVPAGMPQPVTPPVVVIIANITIGAPHVCKKLIGPPGPRVGN